MRITSGLILGLGLGGFIDGIALHQIMQWAQHGISGSTADYDGCHVPERGRRRERRSVPGERLTNTADATPSQLVAKTLFAEPPTILTGKAFNRRSSDRRVPHDW